MTTSAKTSAKKMLMSDLMQTVGILPILILIVAVFGFIAPNFFTESNLLNITRQASINIVLAAGMTFIILTGGIDLSVGSILGTTAVAAMVVSLSPEFAMLSIPAALMLGLLLGLFNGALVAFAGLPPFIVTLGTYTALRGAAYLLADGTTVINSNINFEWIGNNYLGPVPWLVVIALAVIVYVILSKTTFGYQLKACGSNRYAARYAGIKDKRNIVLSMAIAGSLAGAAGSLYYLSGNTEFFWSTYQQLPAVGFNGIPVALLASNHPIGVIFAGMFMSMLDIAGLQLTNLTAYNEYITDVIIAVIVYLAAFSLVIRMWLSGSGKRRHRREEKIIPATQETNNCENIDRPAGDGKEAAEK